MFNSFQKDVFASYADGDYRDCEGIRDLEAAIGGDGDTLALFLARELADTPAERMTKAEAVRRLRIARDELNAAILAIGGSP